MKKFALLAAVVLGLTAGDVLGGPFCRLRERAQARRDAGAASVTETTTTATVSSTTRTRAVVPAAVPVPVPVPYPAAPPPVLVPAPASAAPAAPKVTITITAGADALDEVNALRAARGLKPYIRDPQLTEGARRLASFRARHRLFGHTNNDFSFVPGTARVTGCAAYPASYGWMSCAVYDSYTYAGAAWAMGSDGKRYMHLVAR